MKNDDIIIDTVIIGGGLAGLALAIQLKKAEPAMGIVVLEYRSGPAMAAIHKVGESMSEIGSYYFRETVGLGNHLDTEQIRKLGFRFFFPSDKKDFAARVEIGSRLEDPVPTHQVDRGLLENTMIKMCRNLGIEIIQGAGVENINLDKTGHIVAYRKDNGLHNVMGKWVVDSSGRANLLKRQLNLEKPFDHHINSVWFRVPYEIDIDDFSDDAEYRTTFGSGRRKLATNHLMGKGYWVWIIPLKGEKTSIGIVADPRFHDFSEFNSYEKSIQWLENHETDLAKAIHVHNEAPLDFKLLKDFSYNCARFFSGDRWAIIGEAGAFLDPFYSPGSDLIGMSNTLLADLIIRDFNGEDFRMRALAYEIMQSEMVKEWMTLYEDQYEIFGNTQVMLQKILWDWSTYWALPSLLFYNNGYTDLETLKEYAADSGKKFTLLNRGLQNLFRNWARKSNPVISERRYNTFDVSFLSQFHFDLKKKFNQAELREQLKYNISILEQLAAGIVAVAAHDLVGTPYGKAYNPYEIPTELTMEMFLKCSESPSAIMPESEILNDIIAMFSPEKNAISI